MALQFDQLNNQLKTNDSTVANAPLILTPQGTSAVQVNSSGSNLLTYSQDFTNAAWAKTFLSAATTVVTTDPLGGSTANILTADGTTNPHYVPQLAFVAGPASRTWSVYLKAGTNNFAQLMFGLDANPYANFNLSTGVVGNVGTSTTASIVSAGNGWYRCIVTTTSTTAGSPYICIVSSNTAARFESNSLATTIYVWGGQFELSSTASSYLATTTTAIYNAPVLSFSGVAGIGLQSDGALYVSPAGTGALQAQATTTSSTVGGNARGINAVDWQTSRASANQVASGSYSVLGGGQYNTSSGYQAVVGGGNTSAASSYATFVGGGQGGIASNNFSIVVGGYYNTAAGNFNFIGGGSQNSGTASAAVVSALATQQITVGSLQIALTATNASIKVGQLIFGTGIPGYTYVTSAVATNTVSAMTSTISTTTLSVTALTGTMYIGTVLTGGSISPATAYVTAQLTATNAAAASPTASASSGSTTLVVSSATGIAVGQFVQPITGIPTNTYVLAISGTSITISQATTGIITAGTAINFYTAGNTGTYSLNTSSTGTPTGGTSYTFGISQSASATGTPTLSFYTPHGVVVGGGNNQATGSYSFIGGGGDAGTAANRNVASGDWSVVGGGIKNTASGIASFVGGGGYDGATTSGNTASGTLSSVLGGIINTASAIGSSTLGGYQNTANSTMGIAMGRFGTTRGITGNTVFAACNVPIGVVAGIQGGLLILARQTTDATATVLASDASAASGTNQVILPNNSAYYFKGEVVSGVTGGGDSKGWEISGLIKRGANAAATTLVGSTVTSSYADAGAATWTIALAADTTNGGLKVTFTGQAATTIRTVCSLRTTEMTY